MKIRDPIRDYMVRSPRTIGSRRTLAEAHEMMRDQGIRHLPVVDGGRLVGVVSLRDLHLVETLKDVDPEEVTVDEAMTPRPFTVRPGAPLASVVRTMAEHKWGSAVVVERKKVVGVFTTIDALRLLARLLDAG